MADWLGTYELAGTYRWTFDTQGFDGLPITFAGTPQLEVLKGSSATANQADLTLGVDYAGTGNHLVTLTLDDAFYVVDEDYTFRVKQGTVDGVSRAMIVMARFTTRVSDVAATVNNASALVEKNATGDDLPFIMLGITSGLPLAGLTVTATRAFDGADFAAVDAGTTIAEASSGSYWLTYAAVDVNADSIVFKLSATGARDTWMFLRTRT